MQPWVMRLSSASSEACSAPSSGCSRRAGGTAFHRVDTSAELVDALVGGGCIGGGGLGCQAGGFCALGGGRDASIRLVDAGVHHGDPFIDTLTGGAGAEAQAAESDDGDGASTAGVIVQPGHCVPPLEHADDRPDERRSVWQGRRPGGMQARKRTCGPDAVQRFRG